MEPKKAEDKNEYFDLFRIERCPKCGNEYLSHAEKDAGSSDVDYRVFENLISQHLVRIMEAGGVEGFVCNRCKYNIRTIVPPFNYVGCYTIQNTGSIWFDTEVDKDFKIKNGKYRYDKNLIDYRDAGKFVLDAVRLELPTFDTISNEECYKNLNCVFSVSLRWNELFEEYEREKRGYYENVSEGLNIALEVKDEESGKYFHYFRNQELKLEYDERIKKDFILTGADHYVNEYLSGNKEIVKGLNLTPGYLYLDFIKEEKFKEYVKNGKVRMDVLIDRNVIVKWLKAYSKGRGLEIIEEGENRFILKNKIGSETEVYLQDIAIRIAHKARNISEEVFMSMYAIANKLISQNRFIEKIEKAIPEFEFIPDEDNKGFLRVKAKPGYEDGNKANKINVISLSGKYNVDDPKDLEAVKNLIKNGRTCNCKMTVTKVVKASDYIEYIVKTMNLDNADKMLYSYKQVKSYVTGGPKYILNVYAAACDHEFQYFVFGMGEFKDVFTVRQAENLFKKNIGKNSWNIKTVEYKNADTNLYFVEAVNIASVVCSNKLVAGLLKSLSLNYRKVRIFVYSSGLICITQISKNLKIKSMAGTFNTLAQECQSGKKDYLLADVMEFVEDFDIPKEAAGVFKVEKRQVIGLEEADDVFDEKKLKSQKLNTGEKNITKDNENMSKGTNKTLLDQHMKSKNGIGKPENITWEEKIKAKVNQEKILDPILQAPGTAEIGDKSNKVDNEKLNFYDEVTLAQKPYEKANVDKQVNEVLTNLANKNSEDKELIKTDDPKANLNNFKNSIFFPSNNFHISSRVCSVYDNEFLPRLAERLKKSYEETSSWLDELKTRVKSELAIRRVFDFNSFFTITSVINVVNSKMIDYKFNSKQLLLDLLNDKQIPKQYFETYEYKFLSVLKDFLNKKERVIWDELAQFQIAKVPEKSHFDPLTGESSAIPAHKELRVELNEKYLAE